jgi:hypothetical protein
MRAWGNQRYGAPVTIRHPLQSALGSSATQSAWCCARSAADEARDPDPPAGGLLAQFDWESCSCKYGKQDPVNGVAMAPPPEPSTNGNTGKPVRRALLEKMFLESGLSMRRFARFMGTDHRNLSRWISGKRATPGHAIFAARFALICGGKGSLSPEEHRFIAWGSWTEGWMLTDYLSSQRGKRSRSRRR